MRENEDMFSILPKMILHDIMSRLPEEDAARTSVLSKTWLDNWYTFPVLSFSDTRIVGDSVKNKKNFIDYVKRSLRRFSDQGLAIREFKLKIYHLKPHYMSKNIDFWLKLTCESGVEVLELIMLNKLSYVLPTRVIEAKSLTKLVLLGRIKVDQAFMNNSIKFFSLRVLSLYFVPLKTMEHFISCSPLIENITLRGCLGLRSKTPRILKSLSLSGLQNLKAVDIERIHDVYIDAPSLENLCYGYIDVPVKLDFDMCRNLRELYLLSLKNSIITNKWFLQLFEKFPFLESLRFFCCEMSGTINISSEQLKMLELSKCYFYETEEVNIDAPNLLSCLYCDFSYNSKPIISFLRSSDQLEINVEIRNDFCESFIQNCIKPRNVLTSLSLSTSFVPLRMRVESPTILQISSPLPRIKCLYLRSASEYESSFVSNLNLLFSICVPETISLNLNPYCCSKKLIKFFYEILKGKKPYNCICSSSNTKCWWHDLKDVKVTCSIKIDENVDFETMLESLPSNAIGEYISFTL